MSYDFERDEIYEDEDGLGSLTSEEKYPSALYDRGLL